MHFGRVSDPELIDLQLPSDRLRTQRFLSLSHGGRSELRIGAPIWACREWQESFYPNEISASRYLEYYSQVFDSVEVNSTFYGLPPIHQIKLWASQVPKNFRFCPKLSKSISHQLERSGLDAEIHDFCRHVEAFADRLGLCFVQLPETVGWNERHLLERLVKVLPKHLRWAIELRHPSWFADHMLHDAVINLFYRAGITAVITDTPGRRDALHLSLCQPQVMIRFLGCFPSLSDNRRLKDWANRLATWRAAGMDRIYFFVHQARHMTIPETCLLMKRLVDYEH